jgi:hypothetical protein
MPMSGFGFYPTSRLIEVTGDLTFGTQLAGSQTTRTLRIANKGGDTVTVTGIDLPPGFSGAFSGDIPRGGVQEVEVTFSPTAPTTYFGHIEVRGNHENHLSPPIETRYGGKRWTTSVPAMGFGVSQPTRALVISGDLSFGSVLEGTTAVRTLRLHNVGSSPVTVTGIAYPSRFSGAWSGTIAAGGVQDVPVTFAPVTGGTHAGTITVNGNHNEGIDTIAANGLGASRHIELSGDLAFGRVLVGTSATRTLRIANTGNAALAVTGITYPFALSGFGGAWSGLVPASGFQDVTATFTPVAVGAAMNGTVTVAGSQTGGLSTHPLSGQGIVPCQTIGFGELTVTTWRAGVAFPGNWVPFGGYTPVIVAVTAGVLPDGLSLRQVATEFRLEGTPTTAGTFTFTVTATDVIGCTGSRTYTLTITGASLPASFQKVSPAQNATNQPTGLLSLTWQTSSAATSYEYCIDTTNDDACGVAWQSVGNAIGATLGGLTAGTTYYWQVRASNSAGTTYANGAEAAFWAFTTQTDASPGAPSDLVVSSVAGNVVTLRWTPPSGSPPTGYVLEGGVAPGQVLASFDTGSTSPIYTFTAPVGSFYVRMRARFGSTTSGPSNEIRLHVGGMVPPSPPTGLLGVVNGSTIALAWSNTFGGGAPASLMLDVTGSLTASLPLPLGESFSSAGVPPGVYTVALRAVNGAGSSAASNPTVLTVPSPCTGPPLAPTGFLGYRIGRTVFVRWDPAASGAAPTAYTLNVTGSFVGSLPTTGRTLSGAVGPGTYNLSVVASNACGSSPATAVQSVVVP